MLETIVYIVLSSYLAPPVALANKNKSEFMYRNILAMSNYMTHNLDKTDFPNDDGQITRVTVNRKLKKIEPVETVDIQKHTLRHYQIQTFASVMYRVRTFFWWISPLKPYLKLNYTFEMGEKDLNVLKRVIRSNRENQNLLLMRNYATKLNGRSIYYEFENPVTVNGVVYKMMKVKGCRPEFRFGFARVYRSIIRKIKAEEGSISVSRHKTKEPYGVMNNDQVEKELAFESLGKNQIIAGVGSHISGNRFCVFFLKENDVRLHGRYSIDLSISNPDISRVKDDIFYKLGNEIRAIHDQNVCHTMAHTGNVQIHKNEVSLVDFENAITVESLSKDERVGYKFLDLVRPLVDIIDQFYDVNDRNGLENFLINYFSGYVHRFYPTNFDKVLEEFTVQDAMKILLRGDYEITKYFPQTIAMLRDIENRENGINFLDKMYMLHAKIYGQA